MPHVTRWKTQCHDSAWQHYKKANVNRMVTYKILFLSLFTAALQFIIIRSKAYEWFPGANGLPSMRCKNRLKWKSSRWHGSILKSAVQRGRRKVRRKKSHARCFLSFIWRTKRKRKDLCSLQCDIVDFCGLTVYFKGHWLHIELENEI